MESTIDRDPKPASAEKAFFFQNVCSRATFSRLFSHACVVCCTPKSDHEAFVRVEAVRQLATQLAAKEPGVTLERHLLSRADKFEKVKMGGK